MRLSSNRSAASRRESGEALRADETPRDPRPRKKRTVRAWGIACDDGGFHRVEHKGHRLYVKEADADRMAKWHDLIRLKCGPHSVLPLRGEVEIRKERKR